MISYLGIKTLHKKSLIKCSTQGRSLFYDPLYVDYNSYMYNEEVYLKENNDRALEYFKEKFKDKIIKKESV